MFWTEKTQIRYETRTVQYGTSETLYDSCSIYILIIIVML